MIERNIASPKIQQLNARARDKIPNFDRTVLAFNQSISCKTYITNICPQSIGSGDRVSYVFAA
jgi:hypothetical protein